jgi:ABC-type antimicrobial peptide transport system permease subunit
MRKRFIIIGLVLFLLGVILGFLSGAVLPGDFTIPFIYGSNQILWLFVAVIGFIVTIVGLILKSKKGIKNQNEK